MCGSPGPERMRVQIDVLIVGSPRCIQPSCPVNIIQSFSCGWLALDPFYWRSIVGLWAAVCSPPDRPFESAPSGVGAHIVPNSFPHALSWYVAPPPSRPKKRALRCLWHPRAAPERESSESLRHCAGAPLAANFWHMLVKRGTVVVERRSAQGSDPRRAVASRAVAMGGALEKPITVKDTWRASSDPGVQPRGGVRSEAP